MEELKLPDALAGPWRHALILTYGADLPFFESVLWRQFGSDCRNKVILADGDQLLSAYEQYANSGLVRYVNQQYVAEGIFAPHAAHAKLILLANQDRGRLLVGSGNLSQKGYASGGEIFTKYAYDAENPEQLNAFLSVRELLEGIRQYGYVQGPALKRIDRLFAEIPWLYRPAVNDVRPVRHNFERSFLSQLEEELTGEAVKQLWVMSPFYDEGCRALERMITACQPRETVLLVQPCRTSVSRDALRKVFTSSAASVKLHVIRRTTSDAYVHAKLYLIKTATRDICLQGSPNLSQVAMLLAHPQGNIELASLLTGEPRAFDYLLDQVEIDPAPAKLDDLDLEYQASEDSSEASSPECRLLGGEWREGILRLRFQGDLPPLQEIQLSIAHQLYPFNVRRRGTDWLEVDVDDEMKAYLARPVPVHLYWGSRLAVQVTNPVFVCNEASLTNVLDSEDAPEVLNAFGDLDLEDDELERLLGELDSALMIDRQSVWQLAGRSSSNSDSADEESMQIDYAKIDYETLRKHPRIQQYFSRRGISVGYARTRLQIILNAITDHFRGLVDPSEVEQVVKHISDTLADSDSETEEEAEAEAAAKARQRQRTQARVRRLLINFISRYLQGIKNPGFQELAGHQVMGQNYVIFSHFLWRLFSHDWVEHERVCGFLLETWQVFWGSQTQGGYWQSIEPEHQEEIYDLVREYHADALFLASFYYAATTTVDPAHTELRFRLRDQLRFTLMNAPFTIDATTIENAWHLVSKPIPYDPPRPSRVGSDEQRRRTRGPSLSSSSGGSFQSAQAGKHRERHRHCSLSAQGSGASAQTRGIPFLPARPSSKTGSPARLANVNYAVSVILVHFSIVDNNLLAILSCGRHNQG